MTPEEISRMNFEKSRKAQAENKRIIQNLISRIERLEKLVGLSPEVAEAMPEKTADDTESDNNIDPVGISGYFQTEEETENEA